MANKKFSEFTLLTDLESGDEIVGRDISATLAAQNLRITFANFKAAVLQMANLEAITDSEGEEILVFDEGGGTNINHIRITNAAAGNACAITTDGDDATIGFIVTTKGADTLSLQTTASGLLSFFGISGTVKQTVSGSRAGNAALASLLTALDGHGLITDNSSA